MNNKKPWGIKIHSLYIQNDCELYEEYLKSSLKVITWDEYIDALIMAIENLDKDIIIHRLTGDGDKEKLVAPLWSKNKIKTISKGRDFNINLVRAAAKSCKKILRPKLIGLNKRKEIEPV